jgi:hypothetical protein
LARFAIQYIANKGVITTRIVSNKHGRPDSVAV